MAISEQADEEDLPTCSLGLEPKEKEKREQTRFVSRKTINFQTAPISLSQRESTAFQNDKLKKKLLRNTRQFQQRKSDN